MCTIIYDPDKPLPVRSGQDLEDSLGIHIRDEEVRESYKGRDPFSLLATCLCPFDVKAILDRSGVEYEVDPGFGWKILRDEEDDDG